MNIEAIKPGPKPKKEDGSLDKRRPVTPEKNYFFVIIFLLGGAIFSRCGVSQEVRNASSALVKTQESSLSSQVTFHKSVIATLTMFLDAELARSQAAYEDAVNAQNEAMAQELSAIYSDTQLSEAEKKVNEEKARQKINSRIEKAKVNRDLRNKLIEQSSQKLLDASQILISAEKSKLSALVSLDKYLQAKRPSEKLLEMVNIDINDYTKYVDDANNAIDQAEDIIEQIKNLKK